MKYAILDENGNQIQWCNDDTITVLPANAKLLSDVEWENRFQSIKPSTAEKISSLKRELINPRKSYLYKTDSNAIMGIDLPTAYPKEMKNKRIQAWQEIDKIEAATSLKTLSEFTATFE